jgi:micrococcal nuclease
MFRPRRARAWGMRLLVLLLAAGAVAAVIAWLSGEGEVQDPDPTATQAPVATGTTTLPSGTSVPGGNSLFVNPSMLEPATVVGIVDGDTIDVLIDGREERVRFYGVDTPERGDECFSEARDRVAELAGERVQLLPDARERDSFGRLLRYVFTHDGLSIDQILIAQGLGLAWREDGAFRVALIYHEDRARETGQGCLW